MKRWLIFAAMLLASADAMTAVGPGSPSHFISPANSPIGSYATFSVLPDPTQYPAGVTAYTGDDGPVYNNGTTWEVFAGSETSGVTSVGLADISTTPLYAVTGTPVTSAGTLDFALVTQAANCVIAGPTTGSAAQPTCRALVSADIPTVLNSLTSASGLTQVGVIGTGTWNGTTVAVAHGGTGLTSYTIGDLPYASGATTLSKLADVATGEVLHSGGVGVAPAYSAIVSADLPAGLTSTTPSAGQILLGNAGGTAYAASSVSGDCTLASTGAITCTKTGGVALGTLATQNGTFSATLTGTTSSIGGSLLSAGGCSSGTVAVTSSTTAMAVVATPVTYPGDGNYWLAYVSTAGTVTVKVCAAIAGTPGATAYNVRVIQ